MTKIDYAAAEQFYTDWMEKEVKNLEVAKQTLEIHTAQLNEAVKQNNWELVNELGFKISSEANKVSFSGSQIEYYDKQLKIIEDNMFDESHPEHESK